MYTLLIGLLFSGCGQSKELDMKRIESSPNFKDGKFHNREPIVQKLQGGGFKIWYEIFIAGDRPKSVPSFKSDLRVHVEDDFLVWFGHSSYMLQLSGKKILVDPVFDSSASPIAFVNRAFSGANEYRAKDMPQIDYLIITHNHYDHLSKSSLKELRDRVKVAIVPLGVGKYLRDWGFSEAVIVEMDWDEEFELDDGFKIFCLTARHYSSRSFSDRDTTLWASFLLQNQERKIYIGGDSGYGEHYKQIGQRFGKIDIAFLENGQYDPDWASIHMFPNEVLKAGSELKSSVVMPVHNSKYTIARHKWNTPMEDIYNLHVEDSHALELMIPYVGEIVPLWKNYETKIWWQE